MNIRRLWPFKRGARREALVRIAGTPTKNSSDEAKDMAREANDALRCTCIYYGRGFNETRVHGRHCPVHGDAV